MGSCFRKLNSTISSMTSLLAITVILSLSIVISSGSPHPYLGEIKEKQDCDLIHVFACEGELQEAWTHCQHLTNPGELKACIQGLLSSPDCIICMCEVLEMLGLYT